MLHKMRIDLVARPLISTKKLLQMYLFSFWSKLETILSIYCKFQVPRDFILENMVISRFGAEPGKRALLAIVSFNCKNGDNG